MRVAAIQLDAKLGEVRHNLAACERLDSWIDHVVTRPRVRAIRSALVGDKQVGGLYPSDHAGIAATLRLK